MMNSKITAGFSLFAALAAVALGDSTINGAKNGRKPYAAGTPLPITSERHAELVPGTIPPRLNYVFAPDSAVNAAADALRVAIDSGEGQVYGSALSVQAGAWLTLKDNKELGRKNATTLKMIDPADLKKKDLTKTMDTVTLRDAQEEASAFKSVASLVKSDGGYALRALTTQEMKDWWGYIAFNIEEPVFIVESKGQKYRFVLGYVDDKQLYIVDELNALARHRHAAE